MSVNSHVPGCACPRCVPAGTLCPGCSTPSYPNTLYATVAALGFARLPLHGGSGAWNGCGTASVLGYGVCGVSGNPCTQAMITAAFHVSLQCTTASKWLFIVTYDIVQGYPCLSGTFPTGTDLFRAVNVACIGDALGPCGGGGGSGIRGVWPTIANTCPTLGTLSFPGPPVMDGGVPNFYMGTAASVAA